MRALSCLVLLCIKIVLSINGWSKWGTTRAFGMLLRYATPLRLPCKTCKSNYIKNKSNQDSCTSVIESCCTNHVSVVKYIVSMPPNTNAAIGDNTIDLCLNNGLASNHEYSYCDGFVIN